MHRYSRIFFYIDLCDKTYFSQKSTRSQRWGELVWEQTSIKANHSAAAAGSFIQFNATCDFDFEKKSQHPVMHTSNTKISAE